MTLTGETPDANVSTTSGATVVWVKSGANADVARSVTRPAEAAGALPPPCTTATAMGGGGQGSANAATGLGARLFLLPPNSGGDVAFAPGGWPLYLSDGGNNAIRALHANGTSETLVSAGQLNNPAGLALSADGAVLYIVGFGGQRIHALHLATRALATVTGTGAVGYAEGGPGVALLAYPYAMALHPSGALAYFSDRDNHRIRTVALPSGVTALHAGSGVAGVLDGDATAAQFSSPRGLAFAPATNTLYVANNHRIRAVAGDGSVTTLAGGSSTGYAEGAGGAAFFSAPAGLALDEAAGLLLVADAGNALHSLATA
jgi:DNA-binding beta-propeller fold protein YncE